MRSCLFFFAVVISLAGETHAGIVLDTVSLAELRAAQGQVFNGANTSDDTGREVRSAGDVNADGISDVIVGARRFDPGGRGDAGAAYVVFGSAGSANLTSELAALDGGTGFRINGRASTDLAGSAVAGIGDINNDGIDDVAVGAPNADPGGSGNGEVYVVFGSDQPFPAVLEAGDLDGSDGFIIEGDMSFDELGFAVVGAGDVNGDGIDDLLVGAPGEGSGADNSRGAAYLLFGSELAFPSRLPVAGLNGANGFKLVGAATGDRTGRFLDGAGDVNGDGIDDLLIAAFQADSAGADAGSVYVVYGSSEAFSPLLELASLNGASGLAIQGQAAGDELGRSVAGLGDINGDGIDDVVVTSSERDLPSGPNSGAAYVIYGVNGGFSSPLDLATLDGSSGFVFTGGSDDRAGSSAGAAGDVNSDGLNDLVIGAPDAEVAGVEAGAAYVVYGRNGGGRAALSAADLDDETGLAVLGAAAGDSAGFSVDGAGDFNDDGVSDLLLGARLADPDGRTGAGKAYVVFGRRAGLVFADGFEERR